MKSKELKEIQEMIYSIKIKAGAIVGRLNAIIADIEDSEYLDTLSNDQRLIAEELRAALREGIEKEIEKMGGGNE